MAEAGLEFRLLGPVEVRRDGVALELGSGKSRALLAFLLLSPNRPVSTDRLIEALWGAAPPVSARQALQNRVSAVRRALGPAQGLLVTCDRGYLVRVEPEAVDAHRFVRLAGQGRAALAAGDPAAAATLLRQALALWRGPAVADGFDAGLPWPSVGWLEERRLAALEDRIEADLARGRHRELAGELRALVAAHPLRERLRGQLMLALYRSGRQAEALAAYRDGRAATVAELRTEPGAELRRLEQAILAQDSALELAPPDPGGPTAGQEPAEAGELAPPGRRAERKLVSVLLVDVDEPAGPGGERDPEDLASLLTERLSLVGSVVRRYGGTVEQTVAGTVLALFGVPRSRGDDPERAVRAALALRDAIGADASEGTRGPGPRLRAAVVTGEALVGLEVGAGGQRVTGDLVALCTRLVQATPPGSVMVSAATERATARAVRYDQASLIALGGRAEPLAVWRALEARDQPGPGRARTGGTPLVGRERELEELTGLLRERVRLLTLTGAGGSGKTRLGLAVAEELLPEFPDGVVWVPLAAVGEPELVLSTIARAVGSPGSPAEHLAGRRMLLLLDNFEQVLEGAAEIGELIGRCPNLRLLVTSRAALRLSAEWEYPVEPLPEEDAVRLFVARARAVGAAVDPDESVAEICGRLDGLPLAIELAAARARALAPVQLLARLEQRLPLLTGGPRDASERQRTLRAAIGWSYDLLHPDQQQLFAGLAVFAGGFELEASEAVCDASLDAIEALITQSLLRRRSNGRLGMLETIREYALERLGQLPGEEELRARHAVYYHALALTASLDTDVGGEQHPEIVIPEAANLRAALAWALERGETEFGLELLVALEQFWVFGYTAEGTRWFRAFLEDADAVPALLRARALRSFGSSAHFAGDRDLAERLWEESLAEYERLEDDHGIAVLLHRLSVSALEHGDVDEARKRSERSLELHRALANDKGAVQPMTLLGALALRTGDRDRGVSLLEESAELAAKVPWRWWRAGTLSALADVAIAEGRTADARPLLHEALGLGLELGDRVGVSWYLSQVSLMLAREGRTEEAGRVWGAVEEAAAFIPGGPWPRDAERLERDLRELASDGFERGRELGSSLTLEEVARSMRDSLLKEAPRRPAP